MIANITYSIAALAISATAPLPPCSTALEDALTFVRERQRIAGHESLYDGTSGYLALGRVGVTDEDLPKLCPLTWVTKLDLFNDGAERPLTGKNLEYLGHLSQLEELDLDANALPASALEALVPLQKLRDLRLYRNPLGGDGIEVVNKMPGLQTLYLHNDGITDDDLAHFAALAGHPGLKALVLIGNAITVDGLVHLRDLGIEHLDLTGNALDVPRVGSSIYRQADLNRIQSSKHLAAMPNLTELNIGNNPAFTNNKNVISEEMFFWFLRDAPKLENVSVEGLKLTWLGLSALLQIPNLKNLNLSRTGLSEDGLLAIATRPNLHCVILPREIDLKGAVVQRIREQAPQIKLTHWFCDKDFD